ncbi:MAG: hypothetical protein GSR78_03540 [Desulfurococcales archaeon]|nr:hypothetical protein [Desulfurococcales archaeon]
MYYDLSIINPTSETLAAARRLGYTIVGSQKEPGGDEVVKVVRRVHVKGSTRKEIARALGKTVKGEVLVVVEPLSLEAARYAAVNKKVHLIRVAPGMQRIIDRSTKRLFEERGWGAIELTLKPATLGEKGWFRYLYISLRKAYSLDIPVVVVSDAESEWELWHPRSAAGLAELAGIPGDAALSWFHNSARRIITMVGLG